MKFSDPYMFYLVWVVFLLGCVVVYGGRKRRKILSRFALDNVFNSILPGYSVKRRTIKGGLVILSLIFIVIALAGPLVGFKWKRIEHKGVDIMICLDCSRSMLAEDIKPDRLERAKHEIIDLLRMMKSDRAGLVAFAGDAVLQCPLTMDYSAFNIFLNALNPDYLPIGGTNIGGAIKTALNGFEKNVNSDKAIILITDGGSTTGHPFEAAKQAAKQGVKIFCIGVGSFDGAPVPNGKGGFVQNSSGRIIMSRVNDNMLKKIAAIANGRYVKSVAGNMDLDIIYKQDICKTMKKKTLTSTRRKIWENRFQWFLFPGLIFLFAELFIDDRKKLKIHTIFFLVCFMMLFPFTSNCHAGAYLSVKRGIADFSKGEYGKAEKNFIDAQLDRPKLPDLYYDIGTAAYKKGDFKSALRNFKKALNAKDKTLKINARYNFANTEYKMGNLEKAVKDYEKVLKLDPKNKNAKENLEFVKKKIKERKKNKNRQNKKQNPGKKNNKTGKNNNKNKSDKQQQNKTLNQNKDQNKGNNKKNQCPKKSRNKDNKKSEGKNSMVEKKQKKNPTLNREQEMMLNRLQDKPGRAMIPAYRKHVVEKNW